MERNDYLQVAALPKGGAVEIEAVALVAASIKDEMVEQWDTSEQPVKSIKLPFKFLKYPGKPSWDGDQSCQLVKGTSSWFKNLFLVANSQSITPNITQFVVIDNFIEGWSSCVIETLLLPWNEW